MTLEDELSPWQGWNMSNMPLDTNKGGQLLINSRKREAAGQSRNDTQLGMFLVMKVRSNAIKSNIA